MLERIKAINVTIEGELHYKYPHNKPLFPWAENKQSSAENEIKVVVEPFLVEGVVKRQVVKGRVERLRNVKVESSNTSHEWEIVSIIDVAGRKTSRDPSSSFPVSAIKYKGMPYKGDTASFSTTTTSIAVRLFKKIFTWKRLHPCSRRSFLLRCFFPLSYSQPNVPFPSAIPNTHFDWISIVFLTGRSKRPPSSKVNTVLPR